MSRGALDRIGAAGSIAVLGGIVRQQHTPQSDQPQRPDPCTSPAVTPRLARAFSLDNGRKKGIQKPDSIGERFSERSSW
jgi:hypothetical protein